MKIVINADDLSEEQINIITDTLAMMGASKISYESAELSVKDGKRVYKKESSKPIVIPTPTPTQVEAFHNDLRPILASHLT